MMREIKFRTWHKDDKQMDYPEKQSWIFQWIEEGQCIELMQFTGLKDKHVVEIYEGDVVRILYTDWPSQSAEKNGRYSMSLEDYKDSISNIGKVVFLDCSFRIQFNSDGYTDSIHCGTHGQIKVIGNIHENPELLE